jgi:hypothetical protein
MSHRGKEMKERDACHILQHYNTSSLQIVGEPTWPSLGFFGRVLVLLART